MVAPGNPPTRRVHLKGARNVRDLGGYRTADGRRVRPGVLYRGDSLARLRARDWASLAGLGVRHLVDFREADEVEEAPVTPPDGFTREWLPITVGGRAMRDELRRIVRGESHRDPAQLLVVIGRSFVTDHSGVYGSWLRRLADDADAVPQLFHCTAGKDRTGFAAALILRLLGVPAETVRSDYLATNLWLRPMVRATLRKVRLSTFSRRKAELIRPLLLAEERYLDASFRAIEGRHGSLDGYARDALGLSAGQIEALRERLLEPGD